MTRDEHLLEKWLGEGFQTVDQVGELADGVVFGRKAVGDGLELEIGKARETRLDVSVESEFVVNSVDVEEGDTESGEGKKLREFEHGVDMPLSWEGEDQNMRLCSFLLHCFSTVYCALFLYHVNLKFINHYLGFEENG